MTSLLNFVLFQAFWFAAVLGAARGELWWGPAAALVFVVVHLAMVPAALRRAELGYLAGVTVIGGLLDTMLHAFTVTSFPTSSPGTTGAWPPALGLLPPPWILSCWLAFACLPRFSLGWLVGRPRLAIVCGALGGPLSYLAGVRFGATAIPGSTAWTAGVLAVEYALLLPLMLALVPRDPSPTAEAPAPARR